MNKKLWLLAVLGLMLCAGAAEASNCSSYPFTLTNGQIADATQVMSNFNSILGCANSNLAHNGVNSDITQMTAVTNLAFSGANSNITSLSGLTTPLSVAQGGTGWNTATLARTNLGLGTSAVENLLASIIDDGAGNLKIANSGVTAGNYTSTNLTVSADGRITAASNGAAAAGAATSGQMEGGSLTTVYASPGTMTYAIGTAKAWVSFSDNSGITTNDSLNMSVSGSGGTYTLTFANGLSYNVAMVLCNGYSSNPLYGTPTTGGSGANPTITVKFFNSSGSLQAPTGYANCVAFGKVTN